MTATGVLVIRATGGPFDVGYQHRAARSSALRAFIADDLCRINRLVPAPVPVDSQRPALTAYRAAIAAATLRLNEEIDGLADGAATGDIRRERTAAAVLLLSDRGELHLRPGHPSRNGTRTLRFAATGLAAGVSTAVAS